MFETNSFRRIYIYLWFELNQREGFSLRRSYWNINFILYFGK